MVAPAGAASPTAAASRRGRPCLNIRTYDSMLLLPWEALLLQIVWEYVMTLTRGVLGI